jgi:hypothetical protein
VLFTPELRQNLFTILSDQAIRARDIIIADQTPLAAHQKGFQPQRERHLEMEKVQEGRRKHLALIGACRARAFCDEIFIKSRQTLWEPPIHRQQ